LDHRRAGAAVACERYEIALRLSFASYATLRLPTPQEA
jgi:hypothetical protein